METSLLAIGGAVAEADSFNPTAAKPSESGGSSFASLLEAGLSADKPQSHSSRADKSASSGSTPPPKTDNKPTDAISGQPNPTSNRAERPAEKPATPATPPNAEPSEKPEKQTPASQTPSPSDLARLWLSTYSLNPEGAKEVQAMNMQPKAGRDLAQLIADARAARLGPGAADKANPTGKVAPLTTADKIASKAAPPDPLAANLAAANKNTHTNNPAAHVSTAVPTTPQNAADKQAAKEAVSNLLNNAGNQKPSTDGKTASAQTSASAALLPAEKPASEAATKSEARTKLLDKQLSAADKSLLAADSRTPASKDVLSPARPETSQVPSQLTQANPAKSPTSPEHRAEQQSNMNRSALMPDGDQRQQTARNAATDANPKSPALEAFRITAGQKGATAASKDRSGSGPEQTPLQHNTQPAVVQTTSNTSAQTARAANNTPPQQNFVGEQLTEQIRTSLRQGDQQITIRLNPPELGKVLIRFQEQNDQITGLLEVSRTQTRYEIEQALPQIIRTLHDAGVQVRRLEVVLNDQAQHQGFKEQSQMLQDGSFNERTFNQTDSTHRQPSDEWLPTDTASVDVYQPQLFVTEDSINMLI
ncbi:MAG TPA: flagellar hook-length control protein FliK [Sedimentisphaerales bacterium]|nr:flagellar hook-length control protein FliK [Sedimentisphaerales bacterium]